jgi:O-antigen/teichoic acid export membrane protein
MSSPRGADDASHAARSGGSQLLATVGQGLVIFHKMFMARLFGNAVYGLYRTSADLCELVARSGMVAADKGLLRFIAAHRGAGESDLETASLGSAIRLAGLVAVCLFLLLIAVAPGLNALCAFTAHTRTAGSCLWGDPLLPSVVRPMAPAAAATSLMWVLIAATLGAKVTRVNLIVRGVAEPILLVGSALTVFLLNGTVVGLALAQFLVYLVLLVLAAAGAARVFGARRFRAALVARPHPGFTRFVVPIGLSEILNTLVQKLDIFILCAYVEAPTVGVYAAAEEIGRAVAGIRYAFDSVVSPMLAEALYQRDRERARYNLALVTRWVASVAAPLAATVLVLRRDLLGLYGPKFVAGAGAAVLLVLGHLVNGVLGLVAGVLMMSGRSQLFFWNNLVAVAVNLSLALLLIPRQGILGAAIASFAGTAVLLAAFSVEAWWLERIHPFDRGFAKPFIAAAVTFAAELGLARLPLPSPARIALVVVGGAVVYLPTLLALRPGEEELRMARRLLGRLGMRRFQDPPPRP